MGDRVRFRYSLYTVEGEVIENRGPLGVGGRWIYAVRFPFDLGELKVTEIPADELEKIE